MSNISYKIGTWTTFESKLIFKEYKRWMYRFLGKY
jgi:hypothetical protein